MKVYSDYTGGRLSIYLQGELDHHEAKQSMAVIENLLTDYIPRECVLDLRELSFMDSSGIALMLKLYRRVAQNGGRTWVENAAGQPLRVIDASGIERIIKIAAVKEAGI